MRRLAALFLLCVFGAVLPSATVIALAAPAELVPICCRVHGAHHCMMAPANGAALNTPANPAFREAGCPYRQGFHAITSGPVTAGSQQLLGATLVATPFRPIAIARSCSALRFSESAPRAPPTDPCVQA